MPLFIISEIIGEPNIKNLFDVGNILQGSDGRVQVQPGAPLTVLGTFSVEF